MKLSKEQIINYLVDCKGLAEDDARHELSVYGVNEMLTNEELQDCYQYAN